MDEATIPDERLEAHLYVLPPGARDRCPGRAHPADAWRAEDGGVARVPRPRGDDGQAARPCDTDQRRRDPVWVADHLLPDRLAAVLAVVYLIFNEGYGGRADLAAEAIRLRRALAKLMPDEPEVHGLLALMLVNDAGVRRGSPAVRWCFSATRIGRCGTLTRSPRAARRSIARWLSAAAVPTCCRRR